MRLCDRPDLACQARLKYAEYLVGEERYEEAIDGLALAVRRFPEEGNFIPRILDRLEEICKQTDLGPKRVAQFYSELLPSIPQKRGNRPSNYCISMYERGIKHFRAAGLDDLVAAYEAQLALLEAQRDG